MTEIATTTDVLPTFASLAGCEIPSDRIIDGKDISCLLLGLADAKSPHETLYYEDGGVRQGEWKLVHYRVKADRYSELYDLESDLGETTDLADQYPEKVAAMLELLEEHRDEIRENVRPAGFVDNPTPLLIDNADVPTLEEYYLRTSQNKTR